MSQPKEEVLELIQRMPSTATLTDILDELYFKVDRGLRDVVAGRTLSHQELKERLAQRRRSSDGGPHFCVYFKVSTYVGYGAARVFEAGGSAFFAAQCKLLAGYDLPFGVLPAVSSG